MTTSVEEQAAQAMEAKEQPPVQEVLPPKEEPKETVAVVHRPTDIAVEEGRLVPQTLAEATRIAKGLLDSGCIPAQFKTVPQVLMGQQFLRQLGLPDIACLPKLAIIRGSYSLWGEGPKAVCQPQIEDFEEFWFDKDYNVISFANKNLTAEVFGALCRVKRTGIPTWVERTFTVDDAKLAGLWSKAGPWKEHPRRMLQMRTRGWVLKDAFPDKLMGLAIAEYDHDTLVDAAIDAGANRAPELVERFK
jgi:hypothetical protein